MKPKSNTVKDSALAPVPCDLDCEKGALGSLLLDPAANVPVAKRMFPSSVVFYDESHRQIYDGLIAVFDRHAAVDVLSLSAELAPLNIVPNMMAFLAGLQDQAPSASAFSIYAATIVQKWQLRELIVRCDVWKQRAVSDPDGAAILIEMRGFAESHATSLRPEQSNRDLVREVYDDLMEIASGAKSRGLKVGIRAIDSIVGGFRDEFIIVAARPSMGKTSLAVNIACNLAAAGVRSGFISLEMTKKQLLEKATAVVAKLDLSAVDQFEADEHRLLTAATAAVGKMDIDIYATRGVSVDYVCATATDMVRSGAKMVIIDYFSLIKGTDTKAAERDQYVEISSRMPDLAKRLGVPILMLHQLNRATEQQKRPRLSNLSGSGSLEQDADVVIFLHQPGFDESKSQDLTVQMLIVVEKRRSGRTGEGQIIFRKTCGLMEDIPLGEGAV